MVTHGVYTPRELEGLRSRTQGHVGTSDSAPLPRPAPVVSEGLREELESLRAEVAVLRERLAALEARLGDTPQA